MIEAKPIIDGEEWKEWAQCFAAKRWVVATGGERERFRALLSGWELDAICRFVPLPDTHAIRMHFHGVPVSVPAYRDSTGRVAHAAVRRLFEAGASLNIARMEHYSNAVLRLSRLLEAELRSPVQVNLYRTPPGGQGLGSHLDDHDVVVVQLEGEKYWQISAPDSAGPSASATAAAQSPGEHTATLQAGDWLYLPRGIRHEVRNSGPEPSLHLTIGFHPLTWGAILERALVKARAESRLLNEPLGADPEIVAAESLPDRLRELRSFIDVQAEVEQHRRVFRALGKPIPATEVPDRGALDASDADTSFAWRTGAVSVTQTTNGLELDLPYRRAPLLLHLDLAPWIERMSHVSSFCPRDLDGEDLVAATLLARFLAGAGVLALGRQ
jgi:hypothetical protein